MAKGGSIASTRGQSSGTGPTRPGRTRRNSREPGRREPKEVTNHSRLTASVGHGVDGAERELPARFWTLTHNRPGNATLVARAPVDEASQADVAVDAIGVWC